jgi:hypothetical protein
MTTGKTWTITVSLNASGDLVWSGYDRGPHLSRALGATDYEWWRYVRAPHVSILLAALGGGPDDDIAPLVRERFDNDLDLAAFAKAHGIPTEFGSRTTTDWGD